MGESMGDREYIWGKGKVTKNAHNAQSLYHNDFKYVKN